MKYNIEAKIIMNTLVEVPYYNYKIQDPETVV